MRLDRALVARGLVGSRTRAQELIAGSHVTVDGVVVTKPSVMVDDGALVEVTADDGYVSRAAYKLIGALDACPELSVDGRTCLDVGASTGGFTQVLLERGAARVHAIDVGHGQLAPAVGADPRVRAREGLNARELTRADLDDDAADLVVADVSFISLTLLLAPLVGVLADDADLVLMVKPQFEIGKERLGRGGVVVNVDHRAEAVLSVVAAMMIQGLAVHRIARSPLPGPHGNVEFFVWASRPWEAGGATRARPAALTDAQVREQITVETGGKL